MGPNNSAQLDLITSQIRALKVNAEASRNEFIRKTQENDEKLGYLTTEINSSKDQILSLTADLNTSKSASRREIDGLLLSLGTLQTEHLQLESRYEESVKANEQMEDVVSYIQQDHRRLVLLCQ